MSNANPFTFEALLILVLSLVTLHAQDRTPTPPARQKLPPKPLVSRIASVPNKVDNVPGADLAQFRRVRRQYNLFSWTNDKDHEDAGIETDGGGNYSGVFALHTIYTPQELKLIPPSGATDKQTLFAPTTRPPNGACLEMGTEYTASPTQPVEINVYVYDFCASPQAFVRKIPVDASFIATYAGSTFGNARAYAVTIFSPDKEISENSTWYAKLFNYKTNKYDVLYTGRGYFPADPRGWTIFETWYQAGQCSQSLPVLGASELSYYNTSTAAWEPLALNMHHLTNYVHNGGQCFDDDSSPATYKVELLYPNDSWRVISTGH